jgi:MYXO-CTERM domain-containing protein
MNWASASDAGGPIFYELAHDGLAILYPIEDAGQDTTRSLNGSFLCSGTMSTSLGSMGAGQYGYSQFRGQSGTYQIVAIDLAGNRSAPLSVTVAVPCDSADGGATTMDATAMVDAFGPSWDGLYAIAVDGTTSGPDLSIVSDATKAYDGSSAMPDAATVALTDGPAAVDLKTTVSTAEPAKDGAGCSCRVADGNHGFAGLAIVALALALGLRRRRGHALIESNPRLE